jgi:hypothetical protein
MRCRIGAGVLLLAIILTNSCYSRSSAVNSFAEESTPRVVGGPCEYRQYKGRAVIDSVTKKEMRNKYDGPSVRCEVKFSFFSEEEIEETYGQVEGRNYVLLLTNSQYPGPEFLEKYGIEAGKSFECYLKVITRGACTPVLFDFPTIDLGDCLGHNN